MRSIYEVVENSSAICSVCPKSGNDLRVLIHEARRIVDLVVYDHVQIFLGGMVLDLRVSEFLRHCVGRFVLRVPRDCGCDSGRTDLAVYDILRSRE